MKTWQQRARMAVIAIASFALWVTVAPQIASGLGPSAPGSVTGTVAVTGAPAGFVPVYTGAAACPTSNPPGPVCANPVYSLASNGTYTLPLTAGSWNVVGFYEVNGFGGAFLGTSQVVTVPGGGTVTLNLTVPYTPPASLNGTIAVYGAPPGDPIQQFTVLLCPSYAPYTGGAPSIACVNGYAQPPPGATSAPYSLTGLPPGVWTAYPGYCAPSGCGTNASRGKTVTLVAGQASTGNVSTPFILTGDGLLSGTVAVTNAPLGFSDEVGVTACQVANNAVCQYFYGISGNRFYLLLPAGQWNVHGFYVAAPYNNAVDGPTKTVLVNDGEATRTALSVPYQVPGSSDRLHRGRGNPERSQRHELHGARLSFG